MLAMVLALALFAAGSAGGSLMVLADNVMRGSFLPPILDGGISCPVWPSTPTSGNRK